jgi:hypothetical protein
MWTLIRNGGFPMWFILAFGLTGLGAAFWFAVKADKKHLGFIKNMALATFFATMGTSCADVGATLFAAEKQFPPVGDHEARDPSGSFATEPGPPKKTDAEAVPRAMHIVVAGLAESTSPGIMGFSFLALTAMLSAVGRRRLDERAGAK